VSLYEFESLFNRIKRKMSYHIIQTFIPSIFFIIVTWLAYLIPPRMIEARIGVTMTTVFPFISAHVRLIFQPAQTTGSYKEVCIYKGGALIF